MLVYIAPDTGRWHQSKVWIQLHYPQYTKRLTQRGRVRMLGRWTRLQLVSKLF